MKFKKILLCLILLTLCTNALATEEKLIIALNSESKECGYVFVESNASKVNLTSGWTAFLLESELMQEIEIYDFNKQVCASPLTTQKVENCCLQISYFYYGEVKQKDKPALTDPYPQDTNLPTTPPNEDLIDLNTKKPVSGDINKTDLNNFVENKPLPPQQNQNFDSFILPAGILILIIAGIFCVKVFLTKKAQTKIKKKRFRK
jgi:hypothetical protein